MSAWAVDDDACLDLPEDVWPLILSKIPVSVRLGSCSRVSSKLHRTAAAVTTAVVLSNPRHDALTDSFPVYLSKHGQHLTSIKILSEEQTVGVPFLPCPHLRQLNVEGCSFRLSSASAGIVQACTGLTYLRLERCRVAGFIPSTTPLAAMTNLQHLDLFVTGADYRVVPHTLLRSLTQLTHLGFGFDDPHSAIGWLQDVSRLTKLQELSISERICLEPCGVPGLSQLTALTSLCLDGVRLDPALLRDISTQLQSLQLNSGVSLVEPRAAPSEAAARLLSCIGSITRLQQLCLSKPCPAPADAAAYTALTASSNLQRLELCGLGRPEGIWQAVFPEGHTVPNLQSIRGPKWTRDISTSDDSVLPGLNTSALANDPSIALLIAALTGRALPGASLSPADVSAIVSCCPGLQALGLCLLPDVSLSPLSSLTTLVGLRVEAVTDASMQSLAALTQLMRLSVKLAEQGVRVTSLVGLTALRRLRELELDTAAVRLSEEWDGVKLDISTTSSTAPDVWRQLLEQCADNTHCRPLVLGSLSELPTSQQQQQQQQQQGQAEDGTQQLRQQLKEEQGPATQQQQELVPDASQCEQLRARLQAL